MIDVDGQEGTVTNLPPMQETRSGHALAAAGSLLFAFGGWIKDGCICHHANSMIREQTGESK